MTAQIWTDRRATSVSQVFGDRYLSKTVRRPSLVNDVPTANEGGVFEGYLSPKTGQGNTTARGNNRPLY